MRLWLKIFLILLPVPGLTQDTFFQFGIDQDQLAGAPDFSFLNRPLEQADQLFVRDGRFHRVGPDLIPNTADDERVRLFGVNLAFGANFPSETDASRIAKRLRKLGVNLVRLHHMDTQPDRDPSSANSILTTEPYPTLNPVAVARLRSFMESLKAEGIHINLNLHVGYQFRPSVDGVPALPAGMAIPSQSKPLHIFFPRMVQLQSEFTRAMIGALGLEDNPVLAMVEINNETSLLHAWQTSGLDRYLAGDYKTELQRQWNAFLQATYSSTDSLRSVWGGNEPDGPELLGGQWRLEVHAPAQASLEVETEVPSTVRVRVSQGGAPVILKQVGFSVITERPYLAEFEIRADLSDNTSRTVYWDIKQDVNPWRTVTGRTVAVTNQWQKFAMIVRPAFAMTSIGRFGLSVENVEGTVYVRNATLTQIGLRGLSADESLEAGNIALVGENDPATKERTDDYLLFLADRDRSYLREMLRAVRETAYPLVPVAGTQLGYGGLLNLDSHEELDYDDNHFYIDHYSFPNVQWDGRDWRIRNTSSLGSGLGAFQNMALGRQSGRPYTVSEFNQPWPNTYAVEINPTLAAFAAFQDWDSIMHFAYSHGRNWDDGVPNGFNISGDWSKFATIGQSAWLFRSAAIQSGRERIEIPLSKEIRLRATREKRSSGIAAFVNSALGFDPANVFVHPVSFVRSENQPLPDLAKSSPASPYVSDTGELTYDRNARLFLINAPRAAGIFGFVAQNHVTTGPIGVELISPARGFAAILLTSLDDESLIHSRRLLLTIPGFTLRSQPETSPARPQRLVNYGSTTDWWTLEREPNFSQKPSGNLNGGLRPVWMERVEAYVTFRTSASRLTVIPLDGAGKPMAPLNGRDVERIEGGFRIHLQGEGQVPSAWYELISEP